MGASLLGSLELRACDNIAASGSGVGAQGLRVEGSMEATPTTRTKTRMPGTARLVNLAFQPAGWKKAGKQTKSNPKP